MAAPREMMVAVPQLFQLLASTDDKKGVLQDIKTTLMSSLMSESSVINATLFETLFGCLNTSDGEQIKLVCDILKMLLNYIEPDNVLDQFHTELLTGMTVSEGQVREFCVKQVLRAAEAGVHVIVPHCDLISQAVLLVGDDSLSTAQQSVNLLASLGRDMEGLEVIFQGNVFDQIKLVMEKGDVARFRIYEAIVAIASVSPEALSVCTQSGLIAQLIRELDKEDILLQLNVLELLKDLALTHHGIVFLEQEGIIDRLEEMLSRVDSDPLMSFLLPGLVKFFGNIAHQQPKEICGRFQVFINMVFGLVDSEDISLRVIAIETLCFIGESSEGKLALEKQGDQVKKACKSAGTMIEAAPLEYRTRILQAVNSLLVLEVAFQTAELLSLTEQWYSNLLRKPVETILDLAQQPFTKLRCAALEHFAIIALTPWGQKMLNTHPGFSEYLLNRSTENNKEGKEAKYNIVKTLVESPTVQDIFGQSYFLKLKVYEREGPFYILAEAAVALEGS